MQNRAHRIFPHQPRWWGPFLLPGFFSFFFPLIILSFSSPSPSLHSPLLLFSSSFFLFFLPLIITTQQIVPLAAWGQSFSYSIWLRGVTDPDTVAQVRGGTSLHISGVVSPSLTSHFLSLSLTFSHFLSLSLTDLSSQAVVEYTAEKEREALRLCLKHFCQHNYASLFTSLQQQCRVVCEMEGKGPPHKLIATVIAIFHPLFLTPLSRWRRRRWRSWLTCS